MRRLAKDGREMRCRPYSHDTVRCHRKHAETLAELIIGGALASIEVITTEGAA